MVTKVPKDIIKTVNTAGMNKAKTSLEKTLVMGLLAGAFVAFGGFLAIMAGGGITGIKMSNPDFQWFVFGSTFLVGLILVVIAGSELFIGKSHFAIIRAN